MFIKGYLTIVILITINADRPKLRNRGRCRDRMLHVADGKYPCRLLVDRNHRQQRHLGAYDQRFALCSKTGFSGCCKTCVEHKLIDFELHDKSRYSYPKVKKGYFKPRRNITGNCQDRQLHIADGSYSCSLLVKRKHRLQRRVGAFKHRRRLCSALGYSGCCRTCNEYNLVSRKARKRGPNYMISTNKQSTLKGIADHSDCRDQGLMIAGGSYGCSMLVDSNHTSQSWLGAYKNREKLCNLPNYSGCCRTCKDHGLYVAKNTRRNKPRKNKNYKPPEIPEYCSDSNLQIADGGYSCSMLVYKDHPRQSVLGAYKSRRRLCSRDGFSGCCRTCQRFVLSRVRRPCKDMYVVSLKNKQSYACRELLKRRSDIYPDRFDLCADTNNTKCCKSCAKVAKTKNPRGNKKKSNLVNRPKVIDVIRIEETVEPVLGKNGNTEYQTQKTMKVFNDLLEQVVVLRNHPGRDKGQYAISSPESSKRLI